MKATEDTLTLTPVTLRQAQAFVNDHHRHNIAPQGHKFSIGLEKAGILIGVCIVGRPIARGNDDGKTAEVLRVCVLEGNPNANSKLYGAAVRACKAMGYTRVITYTLPEEELGDALLVLPSHTGNLNGLAAIESTTVRISGEVIMELAQELRKHRGHDITVEAEA